MKLKKEYLVLAAIILALGLYLALRQTDRTLYELPDIPEVSAKKISKITINGPEGQVDLEKQDEKWRLLPQGYPADSDKVGRVLDAIDDLTLTAMVSESGNYARYELEGDKKVTLKAWDGDRLKREIDIGKAAGTFNHTHVKLPEDPKVYHARGDFRLVVDKPADEFRDKTVMRFDRTVAKAVEITADDQTLALALSEPPAEGDTAGNTSEENPDEGETPEAPTVWTKADGGEADVEKVNAVIDFMADLKCDSFLEEDRKDALTDPAYRITVTGDKAYTVSIFPKASEEATTYPALSSESPYPFELSQFDVDDLKGHIEGLTEVPSTEGEEKPDAQS